MAARGLEYRHAMPSQAAVLDDYRGIPAPETPEVAALRQRLARLERESMMDSVTGAWNRRYLDLALSAEQGRAQRHHLALSLALVEVDRFRAIGEARGHFAGDEVLRELAARLRGLRRPSDVVARGGVEQFVVLMPSTAWEAGLAAAERWRSEVAGLAFENGVRVTIGVGVAELRADEEPEALLARASEALHRARMEGGNRVSVDPGGASDAWAKEATAGLVRLHWHDALACGHPEIDAQHRGLFERANALLEVSLRGDAAPLEVLAELDRCCAAIAAHFTAEERLLAERGYEHLESHRVAHKVLLARAAALRRAAASGDGSAVASVVEFLVYELVARHMLTADRDFFPLLEAAAPARG